MSKVINTVTEMRNDFDGLFCRLDLTKAKISELEHMSLKNSPNEIKQKKRMGGGRDRLSINWNNSKNCNICIIEIS